MRKFSFRNDVSDKICIGNQPKKGDSLGHLDQGFGLHSFKQAVLRTGTLLFDRYLASPELSLVLETK